MVEAGGVYALNCAEAISESLAIGEADDAPLIRPTAVNRRELGIITILGFRLFNPVYYETKLILFFMVKKWKIL